MNLTIFGNITDAFQIKLDSRAIGSLLLNELIIHLNFKLDGFFPKFRKLKNQEVVFLIENQIDYNPKISFIQGDEHSKSHLNLKANLTASLFLGDFIPENHYISLNLS